MKTKYMRLPLRGSGDYAQEFKVYAGRYLDRPNGMVGVKMAKEIKKSCVVDIPTEDYHTPPLDKFNEGFPKVVAAVLSGRRVYVGCMGGIGRTGLMLAILAKAFGIKNPVEYVRAAYNPHAVETEDQKKFVQEYVIPKSVPRRIKVAKFLAWLFKKNGNLTR